MKQSENVITEIKRAPYYVCPRCDKNTLNKGSKMLPCPRGSCEAEEVGELITTTVKEIVLNKTAV